MAVATSVGVRGAGVWVCVGGRLLVEVCVAVREGAKVCVGVCVTVSVGEKGFSVLAGSNGVVV